MAFYDGPPISSGLVVLLRPEISAIRKLLRAAELTENEKTWLDRAAGDENLIYFFCIDHGGTTVGQIMLHDIDEKASEALVGYHLFQPEDRGLGYGAAALDGLCRYAFDELHLARLVIITSQDNWASRRIAVKCRFAEIGPAREGPDLVVYERRTP